MKKSNHSASQSQIKQELIAQINNYNKSPTKNPYVQIQTLHTMNSSLAGITVNSHA